MRSARFNNEPSRASAIIGIRIQSAWNLSNTSGMLALIASEPTPIKKRSPLRARKNVQMLCRSAKNRLDQPITPRAISSEFETRSAGPTFFSGLKLEWDNWTHLSLLKTLFCSMK